MLLNLATSEVRCPQCRYVRPDEISQLDKKIEQVHTTQKLHPVISINHRDQIEPRALAAFETAQYCLDRDDRPGALDAFRRAAEIQQDFADAHLWVAKLATDRKEQHNALETLLAYDPTNLEGTRLMMVYNGQLSQDEAARIATNTGPQVKTVDVVAAKATELLCPMCGGQLTVDDAKHQIVCRFCGYHQPQPMQSKMPAHQEEALLMALLKRKGQPVIWHVAKRVVQCQQCGAEHTITADKLSERCRFCGSTQVIISDALRSFEQPEALIPFHVTPLDAMNAVEKQLNSLSERLLHPFASPKVEQHLAEGVFLPFWIFNCTAQITRMMTVFNPNKLSEESQSSTLDVLNDIPISGVKSPSPALVQEIANYEMSAAVGYDPKWLAKIPARLYQIDFDKASFDAREIASQAMRRKYKSDERHESNTSRNNQQMISIHQLSQIQSMTFTLMLLPVWIVLLGDQRIALVNGQTGKAAIGGM